MNLILSILGAFIGLGLILLAFYIKAKLDKKDKEFKYLKEKI